ncbi:MAG TPA: 2-phospho-L-lactate transferase [Anaerolineales bacterium]|nr:2-phospho-L-lactate transferase [Anaerolineales bacterium]
MALRVVALAGGVGGAKLADGLAAVLPPQSLTIIVNTGDDFEHLGLAIWPDLDTVMYTLAGLAHPKTGWGRRDETWNFLQTLGELGGPTWFRLGDRDTALHVLRTQQLRAGARPADVVEGLCRQLGIPHTLLPMTEDRVRTMVATDDGELPFQEYFVARACEPKVRGFRFDGAESSAPGRGVLEALHAAEVIIVCPSNPWVSIDPILAVPGIREAVASRPVVAVSPIIAGEAVRGPAAKIFREMGIEPSPLAVAEHYGGLLGGMVIDRADAALRPALESRGLRVRVAQTLMRKPADRRALAEAALDHATSVVNEKVTP